MSRTLQRAGISIIGATLLGVLGLSVLLQLSVPMSLGFLIFALSLNTLPLWLLYRKHNHITSADDVLQELRQVLTKKRVALLLISILIIPLLGVLLQNAMHFPNSIFSICVLAVFVIVLYLIFLKIGD